MAMNETNSDPYINMAKLLGFGGLVPSCRYLGYGIEASRQKDAGFITTAIRDYHHRLAPCAAPDGTCPPERRPCFNASECAALHRGVVLARMGEQCQCQTLQQHLNPEARRRASHKRRACMHMHSLLMRACIRACMHRQADDSSVAHS